MVLALVYICVIGSAGPLSVVLDMSFCETHVIDGGHCRFAEGVEGELFL